MVLLPHEHHNVAITLIIEVEEDLLDHLGVIDEADKLPVPKIDLFNGNVLRGMDQCNPVVPRMECLIYQVREFYDPCLGQGLLRKVVEDLIFFVLECLFGP